MIILMFIVAGNCKDICIIVVELAMHANNYFSTFRQCLLPQTPSPLMRNSRRIQRSGLLGKYPRRLPGTLLTIHQSPQSQRTQAEVCLSE